MIPGISMPRFNDEIGEYEICYSSEFIHKKFKKTDNQKIKTSIDHNGVGISCKIIFSLIKGLNFESQIKRTLPFLSRDDINLLIREYNSLPKGTWFQVLEFESKEEMNKITNSGKTGLSVELNHTIVVNGKTIILHEEYERMDSPNEKLPYSLHINGGSTWSWGRSEHGKAHLELKTNGKGNSIDKIFIPYSIDWNNSDMVRKIELLSSQEGKVSRKERKKLVEWLDSKNNLEKCHIAWNTNNKFNENRVMFIY